MGIVAQLWRGAVVQSQLRSRPQNNTIAHNAISGQIPDSLTLFSMSGIFLLNADNTAVENNKTSIPDNPTTPSAGVGIWLTNQCCGDSSFDPGSQNNILINNDGRGSEFALIVDPDNTQGLTLRGNLGLNLIGDEAKQVKNRSIKTFQEFPQAQVQGQASTPELLIERSQLPKELKARLLTQLAHLMGPGSHIAPPDEPKVFAANQGGVLHFTDFTFVESPAVNPVSIGDLALGIQEPGSDEVLDFADAPGTIIAETDVVEVSPDGSQVSHYQCRLKRLASQALFQRFSLVNVSGDARSDMRSDSFLASSGEPLNFGLGCGEGSFVVASTTPLEGTYGMWLFYRAPGQSIPVQADVNIGDPTGTVVGQAVLHYTINPGQEIHLASVTVGGASGDIAHEVDDDKQFGEDVDWAGEFVGNGTGENQMFRNIGCAVVTVSNILRFYGFDVNPLTLNNGLKEADAFDGADLIFPKIPAYTDTQDRPFHYTRIDQPTNEQVDLELKEQPVIVKVYSIGTSDKTHFLVIKGKQGETYAINDPGNSDIETLTEYFNRISDPLKRKIISLRVLTPESGDSSSVNILGRSPIELLLIDSLGRKTGFDPLASSLVTQIPGAAYESDTSLGDDTGEGNDEERFAYLELTPAPPGLYSIQVVGTGEGSYHLNLINTDSNAQTSLDTQFSGLTMAGKIDVYQVSYSPIPGQPSSVIKTVSFQSLEIDLRLARQLNLIDNDGILKSLIQKLENARKARENQRIGSWSRLAATL
ncbi:MAG: hypothetical protein HYT79_05100 [Elusimicrobia bacterium]|nr:hypothetical protein [Elusimicrobiota bacterium]